MHRAFHGVIAGQPRVGERGRLPRIQAAQRDQIARRRDEEIFGHAAVGATEPARARLPRRLAVVLHPLAAIHAQPATPRAVHDDGIPGRETRCARPHRLDPAGVLVPEGEGQRERPRPGGSFQQMQVGVTRARTADLHQHLPRPGFGHRHVPELARLLPFDELEGLDGGASVRDPVELDLEMQRAAEDLVHPVGRRIDDQPRVLDAAQEVLQRQVDLQAGQRTADAAVHSAAPAHVLVVRALDVELLRIGEPLRVAVGGAVQQVHRRARRG